MPLAALSLFHGDLIVRDINIQGFHCDQLSRVNICCATLNRARSLSTGVLNVNALLLNRERFILWSTDIGRTQWIKHRPARPTQ
jgi:hypothetical protein